eukprot:2168021-Pyramimonas_sp.AAC.1
MFSLKLSQRTVAAEGRTFERNLLAVYFERGVSEHGCAICSAANYRRDAISRGGAFLVQLRAALSDASS